ncbi:MAG: serine/threonine protein kinase PpkA [Moraxellaceae bacterium]|jgi:serine/threonine protein kinase|nr:serine/threonine protein kinase PpkA [Moraxellaceae bacterium]
MTQIQIPGYTLKRKLGQGGMAAVFLAVQESFGREVALKIMTPSLAKEPDFAERFLREARTMASLSHPHIITVHDVGQAGTLYYYAMAALTGGDLTSRIRGGGLTPHEALRVALQVADALAYAHEQGIVHRDIKPDNVLFREVDDAAVLTDFGIAKNLNNNQNQLTQAGSTVGTPKYMSPEQARGQRLDGRSDLYSLGIMLYEMLTGLPPFQAAEAVTLAIMHCQEPVPRLPAELARFQPLLDRLLAKEPAQRPADGRLLMTELDALLNPQRPAAAPRPATGNTDATLVAPAVRSPTPTAVRPPPPPYQPFFSVEEEESGGFFSKSYALRAAFSCDDYEEFKQQLTALQKELWDWLEKRKRKAHRLDVTVQAHPWIQGRVREVMLRARGENSPLGKLIAQADVTLHLRAEDEPEARSIRISSRDGKPVDDTAPAS